MRAAVYNRYGPPEVLQIREVDTPAPGDNDLLIRIRATTVNRTDCGFRKPEYGWIIRPMHGLFRPRRTVLGSELAGEVERVGRSVTAFRPGDRVFGLSARTFGTHAEYIVLPESGAIAAMPANATFEEAAAVCDGLMLGFNIIKAIRPTEGQEILVNGASGSIGSACVQLAADCGANVTAVCNTKNLDLARSLGARRAIDYTTEDFTRDGHAYDAVIDAVGKSSFFRCRKLLKPRGVYISTDLGFLAQNVVLALLTPMLGGRGVRFPVPQESKEDILFFKELIEAGRYRPVIDRRYPLEEIVEATRYVETGEKTGNVVMTLRQTERLAPAT
jgi:NADPH:quinone reductase-like Zn-dependent oxidoreductase